MEKRQGCSEHVFKYTAGPTISPGPVKVSWFSCPPEIVWTDTLQGESESTVDRSCSRGFLREIPGKTMKNQMCCRTCSRKVGNEHQNGKRHGHMKMIVVESLHPRWYPFLIHITDQCMFHWSVAPHIDVLVCDGRLYYTQSLTHTHTHTNPRGLKPHCISNQNKQNSKQ